MALGTLREQFIRRLLRRTDNNWPSHNMHCKMLLRLRTINRKWNSMVDYFSSRSFRDSIHANHTYFCLLDKKVSNIHSLRFAESELFYTLSFLVLYFPEFVHIKKRHTNFTPLKTACHYNHSRFVKVLLACENIDINSTSTSGWTALSMACRRGYIDIVKLLLADARTKVHAGDRWKSSALHVAARYGQSNIEVLQAILVDSRTSINMKDIDGRTALMQSVIFGWTNVVRELLTHPEIDINAQDFLGSTAFMYACIHTRTDIVRLLLDDPRIYVNVVDKDCCKAIDHVDDPSILALFEQYDEREA